MPPEKHALLGASSAHRWLNCPPSARLGEQFPDTASDYAAAGTLAHAMAELKARKYFLEAVPTRTYNARMKKLKADPHYDKGMDAATDLYLEHLKSLAMSYGDITPFVALEVRVDYGDYVPEGYGTADCVIIGGDRLCVVDYKNGAGVPVEAENNPQLMLYALGALHVYAPIYGDKIRTIDLSIVQPNAGGVKQWMTTAVELFAWAMTTVQPAARLAWLGQGEYAAGDWCRFCRARARCSARAAKMLALEEQKGGVPAGRSSEARALEGTDAPILTDAQVGDVLTRALELESWVKDLKDYALAASLEGHEIAGWKAVEGRSTRDWEDQEAAFAALQQRGVPEALLWERKPASVAGLEKALGKAAFSDAADGLVVKRPGKPTLVPASDKRQPYNPAAAAFQAVSAG